MIEISLGKMVLLALIGLIVLGPEKLPEVARTAGALLRRVRSGWDSVRAEVERELEIEQIKKAAREAAARADAAQAELDATTRQIRDPFQRAADELRDAGKPAVAEPTAPASTLPAAESHQAEAATRTETQHGG